MVSSSSSSSISGSTILSVGILALGFLGGGGGGAPPEDVLHVLSGNRSHIVQHGGTPRKGRVYTKTNAQLPCVVCPLVVLDVRVLDLHTVPLMQVYLFFPILLCVRVACGD